MFHVSVIMNDTPSRYKPLEVEQGLSMLVEYNDTKILFDTGYDDRFMQNAKKMGYNMNDLTAVVLSQAHFEHAAGYNVLLDRKLAPQYLFIGSDFFEPKFIKNGLVFSNLASSLEKEKIVQHKITLKEIHLEQKLSNDFYLITCSDKSPYAIESNAATLKYDGKVFIKDDFIDEIALVAVIPQGLVVLTGRCQKGICNVVHYIRKNTHEKIAAIIGGMNPNFSQRELNYLEESGVKLIGICNNKCNIDDIPKTRINIVKVSVGDEFFF